MLLTILLVVAGHNQQFESDVPVAMQPVFAFVYAVLMYNRNKHLSAFQRLLTVVLHCGHATEDVGVNYAMMHLLKLSLLYMCTLYITCACIFRFSVRKCLPRSMSLLYYALCLQQSKLLAHCC